MSDDDLEEALEALAAVLDDVVAEAVGEDFPRQGGNVDARALALEDVAEVLEVGVAAAHRAVLQLEGGDVGPAHDLVVGVHVARRAVRLRVAHLVRGEGGVGQLWRAEVRRQIVWWRCARFGRRRGRGGSEK